MNVSPIRAGDIVEIDKRGTKFHAIVTAPAAGGELPVRPLERWATWRTARPSEVVGHWRPSADTRRRKGLS
jgi:hypothetical protein